ncbi:hypothetical protein KEM48_012647 [Puccinia striiformis f. sp. tritici PST-130]|nr:hypothetical protein KEM48_012647 [Puccinia striiformis f. sp. tritici PST-130]
MSTYRTVHTVSTQISQIKQLDGKAATFPIWRSRMEDILGLQGTLDIAKGTLTRPAELPKDESGSGRSNEYSRGYNPKEIAADWDSLSDLACCTIKLTLSDALSQRYRNVKPASRLFSTIVNAYEKNTCARRIQLQEASSYLGQTITIRSTNCRSSRRGLDKSWSTIRDTVVYASTELSLDDTIGALEAHEVTLNSNEGIPDLVLAAHTKRIGCSNCGRFGHRSADCRKPKGHAKAKAGAAQAVKLGGLDSDSYDDENEVDVIYE